MGNKPKLWDGYIVKDGAVTFRKDSLLRKELSGKHPKVDQDKILEFEAMCETYRRNFMEIGLLRLHTPVATDTRLYQEKWGMEFLFVPSEHRVRVAGIVKGETLVMLELGGILSIFYAVESQRKITLKQLLGDEELFDVFGAAQQNKEKRETGAITEAEWQERCQVIEQWFKTKFHLESIGVDGMFVEQ
jgi:hypothetical protein